MSAKKRFINAVLPGTGVFIIAAFLSGPVVAQESAPVFVQELSMTAGSRHTLPFWLTANQFGVIPSSKPGANLRVSYILPFKKKGALTYRLGGDVIGRAAGHSTFFFQQLFGEVTLGPFLLRAGRKEETAGEVHPFLSQGSMVLSKNAAPITGISLSWPDFVTVPGTHTFLALKGGLKHGWVDGYRITTNPWLHAKSFYVRLGMDSWPVHGIGGILHYAMWGGKHRNEAFGKLPASFDDYLRVFFFRGANTDSPIQGEASNALGNSLGIYDFALLIHTLKFKLRAYRQFYLEDTVATRFRSPWDGLWGLGLTFDKSPALVEEFLWEIINTKRQGSRRGELPGTDNYYNHFVYSTGWTHQGRSLGTPLILTKAGQVGVFNNIILAHHWGLSGSLSPLLQYRFFITYSRNRGANSIFESLETGFTMENARFPKRKDAWYYGLNLTHNLSETSKLSVYSRIAYDRGQVLTNHNFGVTLGIQRRGNF